MDFIEQCKQIIEKATQAIDSIENEGQLVGFYNEFLSKKGCVCSLLSEMRSVPKEEKAACGKMVRK